MSSLRRIRQALGREGTGPPPDTPKRLRPFLEGNTDIASAVLRILICAVYTTLCRTSPDAPWDAQLWALRFLHRFGSSLRPVLHFHAIVLDGVSYCATNS